jgi:hypothetical protein
MEPKSASSLHVFHLMASFHASPYLPLWFRDYQWSYPIMFNLIHSSWLHLTGDSQYFSKEEMMSMAHFYPWKMRYTMLEALVIKLRTLQLLVIHIAISELMHLHSEQ